MGHDGRSHPHALWGSAIDQRQPVLVARAGGRRVRRPPKTSVAYDRDVCSTLYGRTVGPLYRYLLARVAVREGVEELT